MAVHCLTSVAWHYVRPRSLTSMTSEALAASLDAYVEGMPEDIEPATEPMGWRCTVCDSKMPTTDELRASTAKRDSFTATLIDAAEHHRQTSCPSDP